MDSRLDDALHVPGYDTVRGPHRVVFTRAGEDPPGVVIWRVTDPELRAMAARLRGGAHGAWGSSRTQGEWLLAEHVQEALLTFDGERGELVAEAGGLTVRPAG